MFDSALFERDGRQAAGSGCGRGVLRSPDLGLPWLTLFAFLCVHTDSQAKAAFSTCKRIPLSCFADLSECVNLLDLTEGTRRR